MNEHNGISVTKIVHIYKRTFSKSFSRSGRNSVYDVWNYHNYIGKNWQDRYAKEGHQASEIIRNYPYYSRRTQGARGEGLDRLFMEEYLMQAEKLTDSRQQVKVRHSLKDIIGIVFFAVLAGNDEWTEIADFAVDERQTLQKYLELPNVIPSHDTMQRVFFILRINKGMFLHSVHAFILFIQISRSRCLTIYVLSRRIYL